MNNKCLSCPHYKYHECRLMAGTDSAKLQKCILDYPEIKAIKTKDALHSYLFSTDPIHYLAYLGSISNYPQVGEKVLSLTAGFHSLWPGKVMNVVRVDDYQIFLADDNGEYCVPKSDWWTKIFRLEEDLIEV